MSFRVASILTVFCAALLLDSALCADAHPQPKPSASGVRSFPQPANWPKISRSTARGESIGPGVLYERWRLATDAGPLELSVATVDLRNPYVSLAVTTQHGTIVGPGERLTGMADRLNAELGVNADYFDINESGMPLNLVAVDSRLLHQPDSAAAFVVDRHNQVQMGPMTWHVRVASSSSVYRDIAVVNEWSSSVSLALLTPELGANNAAGATELVLSPMPDAGQYRISRVDRDLSFLDSLGLGEIGLAARGSEAESLVRDFHIGDAVTMTPQTSPAFDGIRIAVGGGPLLVRDGRLIVDPAPPAPEEANVRNPVTGAGLSSDGATLWLVVVDGRAPARSIGLTRPQLASLFVALGAVIAMAFDSGGSSEMVVRQPGNFGSEVANAPSDGRERSIADGLLVLNTAPVGPPVKLLLRPAMSAPVAGDCQVAQNSAGNCQVAPAAVLVGSNLRIAAYAVDASEQPVALRREDVAFRVDPPELAGIDRSGTLAARNPGVVEVSASASGAQGSFAVRIVSKIDGLQIAGADSNVPIGGQLKLSIDATARDGSQIAVDASAVSWTTRGGGGRVLGDGTFVAGPVPAKAVVSARAGGATASVTVLSGDHAVILQAVPQPGAASDRWRYTARPANLPGGVDRSAAPDGSPALRLAYDFSGAQATRAAYAETNLTLADQPMAFSIEVYGDGNGEWLRGGYRNADENSESLTIARHVDWQGWKTIRIAIPKQAAWPIVWTRLYAVERSRDGREQGSLWFRNFKLIYAGPQM